MRYCTYPFIIIAALVLTTSCTKQKTEAESTMNVKTLDLSSFSADKPQNPIHLLFIHHSTGGALLADKGEKAGPYAENRIYVTHPNGGGLRTMLENSNYSVHELSYGSVLGEDTDICHWNRKFKDHMKELLVTKHQEEKFNSGTQNKIVIFKSCFPNSWITKDGIEPGDPDSCDLTTANCKAVYKNLLGYFKNQPDTLFVVFTAPPMAKPGLSGKDKLIDQLKTFLGKPDTLENIGRRTRSFNNWLKDVENGWLQGYDKKNIVVFDYYDILTNHGESNWSMYPTQNGKNSHPSSEGHAKAAKEFVPFLNSAVHRMGF